MKYLSKSLILKAAVVLLLMSSLPMSEGFAQATGTITGRVLDQTNALIPGASVEMLASGSTDHIGTLTMNDGTYRFEKVPVGPAELTFKLINFGTVRRNV